MADIEKTCENCEYECEDMEGAHCRHCIHNAEEHFKPKIICDNEQVIRNNVINEFSEAVRQAYASMKSVSEVERATANTIVMGIAEQMKGEK